MKFAIVLKTTAGAAALVTGLAGQPATAADIAQPPMFEQGRQDRNAWEQWFNSLAGDYKTGAFYWAGQRSLPHPGSCQQMDAGFYRGCTDAKVKLATSDELRKTEPAYKAGWNSYTPTVAAISAPEMASAPTPTAAPGSNQTAVEIAKAVAAQLAATKEQQQTPQVTVNLAAPQVSTMAPSPSPPPAYNPAATQPIVVPLPEQPSAPTVASQPLVATVTDAASETAFIDAVERGRRDYNNAGNEMAQGAGRVHRAQAICRALGDGPDVHNWTGTVNKLTLSSGGKGVLEIMIAPDVRIETDNNGFGDSIDHTLIDPDSALGHQVAELHENQQVTFSGRFFQSHDDCVRETSLTQDGSMTDPEFQFGFTDVARK